MQRQWKKTIVFFYWWFFAGVLSPLCAEGISNKTCDGPGVKYQPANQVNQFFNRETVDMSNQGGPSDIEIEPGKEISIYLEPFGMRIKRFYLSLFYEQLRFSRSYVNYTYGVYQPKSEADIYGIKAGGIF
ncbi:MAG: hypothetical protein ACMUHX_03315 [bacterium]